MENDKDDTPTRSSEHLAQQQSDSGSNVGAANKFNPFKPREFDEAVTLFKHRWFDTYVSNTMNMSPSQILESADDSVINLTKVPLSLKG